MDDELAHIYDPAKRREYYLRTRVLKGRKKGSGQVIDPRSRKATPKKTAEQRRAELKARIERLKTKLERLNELVKVLVAQAKRRSGVESQSKYEKPRSSGTGSTSKYEKKTQSQKNAAAKASAKYYDENSEAILKERAEELSDKISNVQKRIKRLQNTGSVGAGNSN